MNKFWVYIVKTPNGLVYVGQSNKKYTSSRWNKKLYEHTTLKPYIEEFGWENLIKEVVKEGIESEKEAKKIENKLIDFYRIYGVCINKNNSSYTICNKEYMREYMKSYRLKNHDKFEEKRKEYYEKNKEKIAEYRKIYNEENKEYIKRKQKEWRENNKDYHSSYYQNHKEQNRERQRRYRERKRLKQRTSPDGCIPLF